MLALPRHATLPLAFAALGVSYFAVTTLRRPSASDRRGLELWERHERDAKIAMFAGLGAGAILWWTVKLITKRIASYETLRKFGEVRSYVVGESAQQPGLIHITQYASRLLSPMTPAQARELAVNLILAANTLEKM